MQDRMAAYEHFWCVHVFDVDGRDLMFQFDSRRKAQKFIRRKRFNKNQYVLLPPVPASVYTSQMDEFDDEMPNF